MDPEEEYPSDSDASDEDFRPDKEEGSASELESDDNVEDEDQENGDDDGGGTKPKAGAGKKRKRTGKKVPKKKAKIAEQVPEEKETAKKSEELDEEDEEQLTDALWADFLAGSNSSSTSSSSKEPAKKDPAKAATPAVLKPVQRTTTVTPAKPETVTKIFEFAGETVEVTEPAPAAEATASKPAPKPAALSSNGSGPKPPLGGRPSGGGLGAVLGQLGKKNKLSVLEKTQLDWKSFKRNEGIEEELQTHNRGRDGYLERQDFLQRADLRQFEIEKNFRQSKSKR